MNAHKKLLTLYFALMSLFFLLSPAHATCVGIGCECTISATPISFGVYDPFAKTNSDSTGTVSVTCEALLVGALVSYNITLSTGSSGNYSTRTLQQGATALDYNLYTNTSQSLVWGDGTANTSVVSNSYTLTLFNKTDNFTVYGSIPSGQIVAAGAYADSILATVVF